MMVQMRYGEWYGPAHLAPKSADRRINCAAIRRIVAEEFDLDAGQMESQSRASGGTLARQVAMYVCHRLLGMSSPMVARSFGKRDHTTVLHACKKMEWLSDERIDKVILRVKELRDAR